MAGDGSIGHYSFPREWEEVMFYACRLKAVDGGSMKEMLKYRYRSIWRIV